MKLFRFGLTGREQPGVILAEGGKERAYDVSGFGQDYDERFFQEGGIGQLADWVKRQDKLPRVEMTTVRLGPPILRPSKVLGIGLNYQGHADEMGVPVPEEPKLFMKATTAICGVYDDVQLPPGSQNTDYEVELAVVIGQAARRVRPEDASSFVAGYTICNDYSERDWQKNRAGQFVKGKSADTFCPLGPVLVVEGSGFEADDAKLWLSVNGELRQRSRTSDMVFSVAELVARVSHYMTLLPGDVITTGTPAGVGLGLLPPTFLRAGDVVEYGIEGIGTAKQRVVGEG